MNKDLIWKEHDVVMLPSNKPSDIGFQLSKSGKKELVYEKNTYGSFQNHLQYQHLYFLSDEKSIEEGDWYICWKTINDLPINHVIAQATKNDSLDWYNSANNYKKIIATTNSELKHQVQNYKESKYITYAIKTVPLPRPSNSFLEAFVREYNAGTPITRVKIEYINPFVPGEYMNTCVSCGKEFIGNRLWFQCPNHAYIKTAPDNSITIRKI